MKARIRFVSNEKKIIKEINTISDLLNLKTKYGKSLIIEDKPIYEKEDYDLYIQVYDDWRE